MGLLTYNPTRNSEGSACLNADTLYQWWLPDKNTGLIVDRDSDGFLPCLTIRYNPIELTGFTRDDTFSKEDAFFLSDIRPIFFFWPVSCNYSRGRVKAHSLRSIGQPFKVGVTAYYYRCTQWAETGVPVPVPGLTSDVRIIEPGATALTFSLGGPVTITPALGVSYPVQACKTITITAPTPRIMVEWGYPVGQRES